MTANHKARFDLLTSPWLSVFRVSGGFLGRSVLACFFGSTGK
jgi:hypothetical protein